LHLHHDQQSWGHGLGRSFLDLPPAVAQNLDAEVADLEDRLRIFDALYIPTRCPDSLPEGAPTDHFGRLQSQDALCHARALVDAICAALAPVPASAALAPGRLPLSCDALVLTPAELQALLAGGTRMGRELQSDVRWLL